MKGGGERMRRPGCSYRRHVILSFTEGLRLHITPTKAMVEASRFVLTYASVPLAKYHFRIKT